MYLRMYFADEVALKHDLLIDVTRTNVFCFFTSMKNEFQAEPHLVVTALGMGVRVGDIKLLTV